MSEKWKEFTNAELIYLCMPNGKEWEVLEYFAENNYKVFINLINLHGIPTPFSRKKVVEHYSGANLEELAIEHPNLVKYLCDSQEYIAGLSQNGKKASEYLKNLYAERRKNFLSTNGEECVFFTVAKKFPVMTKEECFEVANFFMNSGLSISSFCKKYEIDNLDGFKDAMSRVALNNEDFKNYYENHKHNMQSAFIAISKKTIEGIANGTMSVQEAIENHTDSRNFARLVELTSSMFEDSDVLDRFVFNVLSYYQDRVNSYNDSLDPENIKKMLTIKEVSFITNYESMQDLKTGKTINPGQVLRQTLTPYGNKLKSITIHRMFNNDGKSLGSKLKAYSNLFYKKSYLRDNPHQILPDGSTVPVTSDVIDRSMCFATQNNLFKGYSTITKLNRSILHGHLDYSAETEAYKQKLQNQIVTDIAECKSLEEYISNNSKYQKEEE